MVKDKFKMVKDKFKIVKDKHGKSFEKPNVKRNANGSLDISLPILKSEVKL